MPQVGPQELDPVNSGIGFLPQPRTPADGRPRVSLPDRARTGELNRGSAELDRSVMIAACLDGARSTGGQGERAAGLGPSARRDVAGLRRVPPLPRRGPAAHPGRDRDGVRCPSQDGQSLVGPLGLAGASCGVGRRGAHPRIRPPPRSDPNAARHAPARGARRADQSARRASGDRRQGHPRRRRRPPP